MITQLEMLAHFLPIFEKSGKSYRKKSLIKAKKALPGTVVITITSDGVETKNTAVEGDMLVQNQTSSEEQYLVKAETFKSKYEMIDSLGCGWACYKPKGIMMGYELSEEDLKSFGVSERIEFQTPWKDTMFVRKGDFLVTPVKQNEIYRIARKEFLETYQVL
jgi:hypothetical protein